MPFHLIRLDLSLDLLLNECSLCPCYYTVALLSPMVMLEELASLL